jgi:hypothetical protein
VDPSHLLTREELRSALEAAAKAAGDVLAMWEAGSASFGRVDAYSDLDLGLLVRAGSNPRVWAALDAAFEALGGIALRWHEPNPVFKGLDKHTYRLRRAPRWLQVDVGLFPETASDLFNDRERHGTPDVLFDPGGRLAPPAWDAEAHRRKMRTALHHEVMKYRLYHGFFRKELARGRPVDAFRMHLSMTVRPLISVLGMLHRPARWDFDLRYVAEELPPEAAAAIERLCYIPDPGAMEERFEEADALFERSLAALAANGITPLDEEGRDIGGALEV